jgi:1-acyl-sn-glycerol-3-phosphate acyltransferase
MIPARRSRLFTRWFTRQASARIEKTFGRVLVHGRERAMGVAADAPLLVVANHTSWWDPLVALFLADLLELEAYAMMDARNLTRLPFFGLVGAFGVDLADARDGARAIRHAARLLDRPRRAVWIFPEGEERSAFAPLELRPGAAWVARRASSARVVPLGVRYVFGGAEAPDLWISIGAPLARVDDSPIAVAVAEQRDAISAELARIDRAVPGDFEVLHERGTSLVGRLAERLLAMLTRPFLFEAPASADAERAPAPLERARGERASERREKRGVSDDDIANGKARDGEA